ncbi:MAG: hypothetical protein ABIJ26_00355 [Candidatus Margulisiibacteriota bacterium]
MPKRFFLSLCLIPCLFPCLSPSLADPLPYNYRVIDDHIHAGGHPLNPATKFGNTDQQVLDILEGLKDQGVYTVIDLENTGHIQKRYSRLLEEAGMERIHIPMNSSKVPTEEEWQRILEAMKEPVYIHCKWGADRTGAVIGRYLVEIDGYSPDGAYRAVITGGAHAGPLGGLNKGYYYNNLKKFIFSGCQENNR